MLAGDVYSEGPNLGRGGWSWYTGAAGWMYRAGLEYILGLQIIGNKLTMKPCVPPDWKQFKIKYRHGASTYAITVKLGSSPIIEPQQLVLVDDGKPHEVTLVFGS